MWNINANHARIYSVIIITNSILKLGENTLMNGASPLIYICDDEPIYCETISNICSTYMKENNIANYKIEIGYDGNDVINYKHPIDILILDIDMPHLNGIDVKERLSSLHNEVTIIFVTNHNEKNAVCFWKTCICFYY